ncbi:GIY-YIG nuclease family protein [candidate division KSB1 bacterium]
MNRTFYVYIMASNSGTLYVGFTNWLDWRVFEHKNDLIDGCFTKKYQCHKLIYFEEHQYVLNAIDREKQIKKWRREKKQNLIQSINPSWKDLAEDWNI